MADKPTQAEIAVHLGLTPARVSQLVAKGMPTDSIDAVNAWREAEKLRNQREGHVSQPVRPLTLDGLDSILNTLNGGGEPSGDTEMDTRITQQVELCHMTRQAFVNAMRAGDPSQGKLYGNFDKAVATLLRLEKERTLRLQERARLVDADEAANRYGKLLTQLRSLIEKAELTFAPKANPENPPVALIAYREFRDDIFRKLSEYNPQVVAEQVNDELAAEVKSEQEPVDGEQGDSMEWSGPPDES